jgi:hypothetical protein
VKPFWTVPTWKIRDIVAAIHKRDEKWERVENLLQKIRKALKSVYSMTATKEICE